MKKSNKSATGTSYHNESFEATPNQIISIFGKPQYNDNCGNDKVNLEWIMETKNGSVFTIYDWKEYRKIKKNEVIEWHIGTNNSMIDSRIRFEIENLI